jgi:hypothetical protein
MDLVHANHSVICIHNYYRRIRLKELKVIFLGRRQVLCIRHLDCHDSYHIPVGNPLSTVVFIHPSIHPSRCIFIFRTCHVMRFMHLFPRTCSVRVSGKSHPYMSCKCTHSQKYNESSCFMDTLVSGCHFMIVRGFQ